jgi:PIN domain nuclease of toxin-antitoxin system
VILVDTHVVVWLALDPSSLSKTARAAIDEARKNEGGLAISDITLLELTALVAKGRVLQEVEARFVVLPMSARACARTTHLPAGYPKDPADRILAATALVEGLPLLTADRAIRRTKAVQTIW